MSAIKRSVVLAFKAFATISLAVEVYVLCMKYYLHEADAVVQTNLQTASLIGQIPIKEIKLYKDEASMLKKQKTPLNLFWSPGFKGYCSLDQQFATSCRNEKVSNVDAEPARYYNRWRGGVFITVKRYDQNEFMRKTTGANCADGWKDCGLNFCVKQYDSCPISRLTIERESPVHANLTEDVMLRVKEGKVMMIERADPTSKTQGFLNDIIVTVNMLPCRGKNFNGTKKSAETKLDYYPLKVDKCGKDSPELLENYRIIDTMNRNKFNNFNMLPQFKASLPHSEAVQYKNDEMMLAGQIYSIKSTDDHCRSLSTSEFSGKVARHANNHARVKTLFFVKAGIWVFTLILSWVPVMICSSIMGIVFNFLLMTEKSSLEYFYEFFKTAIQTNNCFFNLDHFKNVADTTIIEPYNIINTSLFKNGLIIYSVFLAIFVILQVLSFVGQKDSGAAQAKPASPQKPKEKDEGESKRPVSKSPEADPLARSARESKKVKRDD